MWGKEVGVFYFYFFYWFVKGWGVCVGGGGEEWELGIFKYFWFFVVIGIVVLVV